MFHGQCSTIVCALCISVYEDAEYLTDKKVYETALRDEKKGYRLFSICTKRKGPHRAGLS